MLCANEMLEYSSMIFPFSNLAIDRFLRLAGWDYPLVADYNKIIGNEL